MTPAPLDGVRVLDLTRLLPGPLCSMHLADMGADVIKVEDTGAGDYARGRDETLPRYFEAVNRNKRSVALDLKQPAGRDALLALIAGADVLVEGFRPGVMARLGVDYEAARARNPRIVYCSITGFGQEGPFRDRPGHDINYCGYAGVLEQIGRRGEPPALPNLQPADIVGGTLCAAMGILAALVDAARNGQGRHVDVSMTDGVMAHAVMPLASVAGRGRVRPRGEDVLTGACPAYGLYETADGEYLAVGALEPKFWNRLCELIDRPDLADRGLATGEEGDRVRGELRTLFASRPQAYWCDLLESEDCCVSPVLRLEQAMHNEHFVSRGAFLRRDDGGIEYAPPVRFSGHTFERRREAPGQGEHTREVLAEAGLDEKALSALARAGVIPS